MRYRYAYSETALFVIAAVALLAIAASSSHIGILNTIYPSDEWAKRGEILRVMMVFYGVGFVAASLGSFLMFCYFKATLCVVCLRWIRFAWREVIGTFRWLFTAEQVGQNALWLVLMVAIGTAVRCFFLAQPMRYDESFTFLNFVNRGAAALFYYPVPNNHVLHTLLVRISVGLLGSNPFSIRLPAVVAGLLTIPLTFALSKSLNGRPIAGFLAAAMVAVFPYLILYDTMARGYSLLVFLNLCLVALGLRIVEKPSMQLSLLMALPIAAGLFDMPSFLFPAAGVLCWLSLTLASRGHRAIWILTHVVAPCTIAAAACSVILYTPVVIASNGINLIVANRFVQADPWHQFLGGLPAHIFGTVSSFSRDIPIFFLVSLSIILLGGLYVTTRERRWTTLLLLPGSLIGAMVVLFAKHAIPFDRTWIYLLPLVFVFIDAGIAGIPRLSAPHWKKAMLILSACVAVLLMNRNTISSYGDTGHFPEAQILVDILAEEMLPKDQLIVDCPADAPMHFYMWYKNVPAQRRESDGILAKRAFVVVKPSCQSVGEMTRRNVLKLTSFDDAELYVTDMENDTKMFQQKDALDE